MRGHLGVIPGSLPGMDATPNNALRAVRLSMRMSQDEFASALAQRGVPSANKKLIQRWENGKVRQPQPAHARALERLTGLALPQLGFTIPVPGEDLDNGRVVITGGAKAMPAHAPLSRSNYAGIWLSRYEYFSSGRQQTFEGKHYVVLLQHDNRLTVRSLPGASSNADSPLTMDLTVEGNIVTGTWVEQTAAEGYYRGARYHGTVQMVADPTGRKMRGKWAGFGAEGEVNTGPWELIFQDGSVSASAMERYSRVPD